MNAPARRWCGKAGADHQSAVRERTVTAFPNSTILRRKPSPGAPSTLKRTTIDRHNSQFIRKLASDFINSNPGVYGLTRDGRLVEVQDSKRQPHPSSPNGLSDLSSNSHRQRKPRHLPPDGLKTAAQAAAKLNCSIKTLRAHVAAGDLRYVIIGKGTKRPHRMYAATDLDGFIANQTRKDSPACRSIASRARRSSTSNSASEVIAFSAQPRPRPGAKRKK